MTWFKKQPTAEAVPADGSDAQLMAEWKGLMQAWERELAAKRRTGVADPQLEEFRWLLEELRVGLFAQELKTPMPVSVKRLQKIWDSRPR